jgi:hypothetical protein
MLLTLLALRVRNETLGPADYPETINMSQIREDMRRQRQAMTEKIARAILEQEGQSSSPFPLRPSPTAPPHHVITFYSPHEVRGSGGESVLINVDPPIAAKAFCRFNFEVVPAWITTNRSVMCRVPRIAVDEISLSVSADTKQWSAAVPLGVAREGSDFLWLIGAAALIAAAYLFRAKICRRKKRVRADDPAEIDEALDTGELAGDRGEVRRRAL